MNVGTFGFKGGARVPENKCELYNRTGAALAKGDMVAVNADFVGTQVGIDPTITAAGATGYWGSAAQAVTTSNARYGVFVCADDSIPVNGVGSFWVSGMEIDIKLVTGGAKGDFISPTNGQVYATTTALSASGGAGLDALALPTNIVGWTEETPGATGVTKKCVFFGGLIGGQLVGGGA